MSIITIISHPKVVTGGNTNALTETRREFDSWEEAAAYVQAQANPPSHPGSSES